MFDPKDPKDMQRLGRSIAQNMRDTEWFRRNRRMVVEELPGMHYGRRGADFEVPDNLLEFQEMVLMSQLASGTPRVMVRSPNQALRLSGTRLRLRMNRLFDEIDVGGTLTDSVQDSLNSMGVVKVGMNHSRTVQYGNYEHKLGSVYAAVVDPDDYVFDGTVRRWEQLSYEGNRYRVALDEVMADERYDKAAKSRLAKDRYSRLDSSKVREETWGISQSGNIEDAEFERNVDLYDLWLPRERLLITVAANDPSESSAIADVPLLVSEGPFAPKGPYHRLWYKRVSGNLLPQSPMGVLFDLHKLSNALFRKAGDQAERQKTLLGVLRKALDDGDRIVHSSDGEAIPLDDPKASQEYRFGGVDGGLLAFHMQTDKLFNERGGNLSLLGGISAQSDTLGQDRILNENASERLKAMQRAVHKFTRGVMESIGWWMFKKLDEWSLVERPIDGTNGTISLRFSPMHLQGQAADYEFEVEPYSMQPRTPAQRFMTKLSTYERVVLSNPQAVAQQGMAPDMRYIMQDAAESLDVPEFQRWMMTGTQSGLGLEEEGSVEPPRSAPADQRVSGGYKQKDDMDVMRQLASIGRDNRS